MPRTDTPDSGLSVLLIDDNPLIADVIVDMLEEDGYVVRQAGTAEVAQAILKREKFSLVVCDIGLPGALNGLQLARKLRKSSPGTIMLLMTGHEVIGAQASEEFVVLNKPFGIQELRRLVDYMLQEDGPNSESDRPHSDLDQI